MVPSDYDIRIVIGKRWMIDFQVSKMAATCDGSAYIKPETFAAVYLKTCQRFMAIRYIV